MTAADWLIRRGYTIWVDCGPRFRFAPAYRWPLWPGAARRRDTPLGALGAPQGLVQTLALFERARHMPHVLDKCLGR